MFKLIGKEINAIFGTQTILIWTYAEHATLCHSITIFYTPYPLKWASLYLIGTESMIYTEDLT